MAVCVEEGMSLEYSVTVDLFAPYALSSWSASLPGRHGISRNELST